MESSALTERALEEAANAVKELYDASPDKEAAAHLLCNRLALAEERVATLPQLLAAERARVAELQQQLGVVWVGEDLQGIPHDPTQFDPPTLGDAWFQFGSESSTGPRSRCMVHRSTPESPGPTSALAAAPGPG